MMDDFYDNNDAYFVHADIIDIHNHIDDDDKKDEFAYEQLSVDLSRGAFNNL